MEDTQTQEKTGFQHLFMQLNRAYAAKCFSQMTELGIHPGQIPILLLLAKRVEMSQREIAEELCKASDSECYGTAYGKGRSDRPQT